MIVARLDRYIGRSILVGTALVLSVLLAMTVFFAFVDALSDFGRGNFGLAALARYVALQQARKAYELFPMAVLIGTILGLSLLALNSELIALRAAGISVARILGAALKTGLALILVAVVFGELVVPWAENEAHVGRARALAIGLQKKGSGLWLRDGATYVNVGEVLPDLSLLRVTLYEVDDGLRLTRQVTAERAGYLGDGEWRLNGVREARFADGMARSVTRAEDRWPTALTPDTVRVFSIKPEGLSLWQLTRYIAHLGTNGQDTTRYELAFWQKLLLPVSTAVMMLLAAPFVFRPFRGGGMSQRIFIGVMLGLAFVVVNRSFGYFGILYGLPPALGAALPVALFLLPALYLMRRWV